MCRICEHSVVGPTSPSLWVESFSDCTNSLSTRSVPISRSYGVQNCNANHCSTEHCGACSRRVAPPVYRPRASARSKHGVSASDRPTGASRSGVGAKRSHASCSDEWALQKKIPSRRLSSTVSQPTCCCGRALTGMGVVRQRPSLQADLTASTSMRFLAPARCGSHCCHPNPQNAPGNKAGADLVPNICHDRVSRCARTSATKSLSTSRPVSNRSSPLWSDPAVSTP